MKKILLQKKERDDFNFLHKASNEAAAAAAAAASEPPGSILETMIQTSESRKESRQIASALPLPSLILPSPSSTLPLLMMSTMPTTSIEPNLLSERISNSFNFPPYRVVPSLPHFYNISEAHFSQIQQHSHISLPSTSKDERLQGRSLFIPENERNLMYGRENASSHKKIDDSFARENASFHQKIDDPFVRMQAAIEQQRHEQEILYKSRIINMSNRSSPEPHNFISKLKTSPDVTFRRSDTSMSEVASCSSRDANDCNSSIDADDHTRDSFHNYIKNTFEGSIAMVDRKRPLSAMQSISADRDLTNDDGEFSQDRNSGRISVDEFKSPELIAQKSVPRSKGRPAKNLGNSAEGPGTRSIIKCPICGKLFNNSSALAKHKLTHSDERKYSCTLCSKAFKRQDHLNGHMMTHSSKKPFECKFIGCNKSYCDARSLRRHLENHHQDSIAGAPPTATPGNYFKFDSSSQQPPFQSVDGENFAYLQQVSPISPAMGSVPQSSAGQFASAQQHQVWVPGYNPLDEPKPVRCHICERGFKNVPALNGHMRLHGGYIRKDMQDSTEDDQSENGSKNDEKKSANNFATVADSHRPVYSVSGDSSAASSTGIESRTAATKMKTHPRSSPVRLQRIIPDFRNENEVRRSHSANMDFKVEDICPPNKSQMMKNNIQNYIQSGDQESDARSTEMYSQKSDRYSLFRTVEEEENFKPLASQANRRGIESAKQRQGEEKSHKNSCHTIKEESVSHASASVEDQEGLRNNQLDGMAFDGAVDRREHVQTEQVRGSRLSDDLVYRKYQRAYTVPATNVYSIPSFIADRHEPVSSEARWSSNNGRGVQNFPSGAKSGDSMTENSSASESPSDHVSSRKSCKSEASNGDGQSTSLFQRRWMNHMKQGDVSNSETSGPSTTILRLAEQKVMTSFNSNIGRQEDDRHSLSLCSNVPTNIPRIQNSMIGTHPLTPDFQSKSFAELSKNRSSSNIQNYFSNQPIGSQKSAFASCPTLACPSASNVPQFDQYTAQVARSPYESHPPTPYTAHTPYTPCHPCTPHSPYTPQVANRPNAPLYASHFEFPPRSCYQESSACSSPQPASIHRSGWNMTESRLPGSPSHAQFHQEANEPEERGHLHDMHEANEPDEMDHLHDMHRGLPQEAATEVPRKNTENNKLKKMNEIEISSEKNAEVDDRLLIPMPEQMERLPQSLHSDSKTKNKISQEDVLVAPQLDGTYEDFQKSRTVVNVKDEKLNAGERKRKSCDELQDRVPDKKFMSTVNECLQRTLKQLNNVNVIIKTESETCEAENDYEKKKLGEISCGTNEGVCNKDESMLRYNGGFLNPLEPVKLKTKCRPDPLVILPNDNFRFQSRLRSPRLWDLTKKMTPPPYTPPPMLSPARSGSGLFWTIQNRYHGIGIAATPSPSYGLPPNLLAEKNEKLEPEKSLKLDLAVPPTVAEAPPETDIKPHVNVGPQFQPELPSLITNRTELLHVDDHATLLWHPRTVAKLGSEGVSQFLQCARSPVTPGNGLNEEFALHLLHMCRGNVEKAMRLLLNVEPKLPKSSTLNSYKYQNSTRWTPVEIEHFHRAIFKVDKDFFQIKNLVVTKSVKECIQFYYLWKKVCSDEYKRLRLIRRKREQDELYNLRSKAIRTDSFAHLQRKPHGRRSGKDKRSKSNVFNAEKKAEKDVQNIFSNQFLTTENSIKSFASNDIKKYPGGSKNLENIKEILV